MDQSPRRLENETCIQTKSVPNTRRMIDELDRVFGLEYTIQANRTKKITRYIVHEIRLADHLF